jgi:hypothetical protein
LFIYPPGYCVKNKLFGGWALRIKNTSKQLESIIANVKIDNENRNDVLDAYKKTITRLEKKRGFSELTIQQIVTRDFLGLGAIRC